MPFPADASPVLVRKHTAAHVLAGLAIAAVWLATICACCGFIPAALGAALAHH